MKLKTFTAPTYAEALKKVKEEVGDDAMIVSSREIKKKSLVSPGLYEIVVSVEDDNSVQKEIDNNVDEVMLKLSSAAKEITSLSKDNKNSSDKKIEEIKSKLNTKLSNSVKTTSNDDIDELKKQVNKLADTLKFLQASVWEAVKKDSLDIPPEFSEIYALSKASGMKQEHLDEIMKLTIKYMPVKMRENRETIKRYFYTLLKKMIPIRVEKEINNKKVIMFVGPTGVGKTTTIAKLAARYAYKLKRKYKVGIITLDTYRIGAVEQLMSYAKMMKLPIEVVVDPIDFEDALNNLKHNDYLLIDTVGSSQHDKEKIERLKSFLDVNVFTEININLVLSATTKYEDLIDIYNSFSILGIDTLVLTKLDETRNYGNIFSLLLDIEKPVSYFSIGQEVPDDLIEASADFILKGILDKEFN